MKHLPIFSSLALICLVGSVPLVCAHAQEPVLAAHQVDVLFTDPDHTLDANKQVVYHIMKDLLEAGHWEQAGRYLTERYIQHNPNVPTGRAGVVEFFRNLGTKPTPILNKLSAPVVQVLAEGDLVVVVTVATRPKPSTPTETYTTSWFDMFRIRNGKADEHWDNATLSPRSK